jgi:saccharopine dehydrogenase-like NADP-dependent oxidoreductase
LSEDPVPGLPCEVSPYLMMNKLLGPQLQYKRDEKDLVVMLNVFEGIKGGRRVRLLSRLLIERDLDTGIMAMAKGVSCPAGIVARMIAGGEIRDSGVLSPMKHIPYPAFTGALRDRGIDVQEEEAVLE